MGFGMGFFCCPCSYALIDLDMGAGGWTDLSCSAPCASLTGIFALPYLSTGPGANACTFRYIDYVCTVGADDYYIYINLVFDATYYATLSINTTVFTGGVHYTADNVQYVGQFGCLGSSTLTKNGSDNHGVFFGPICSGTMPGTVLI